MRAAERIWLTGVLLAGAIVFCLLAGSYSRQARMIPLAAGLPLVALLSVQFIRDLRSPETDMAGWKPAGTAAGLTLAMVVALYFAGFLIALPLFVGVQWRRSGAGWMAAAGVAAAVLAVLAGVFQGLLRVDLPAGVLGLL